MGINWSTPRFVKKDTLIVTSAEFPKDKFSNRQIWALWKVHKEQIKKDGFTIAKFKGQWKISYFSRKTPDCEDEVNGEKLYMIEFKQKYNRWYQTLKKLTSADYKQAQQKDNEKLFDETLKGKSKSPVSELDLYPKQDSVSDPNSVSELNLYPKQDHVSDLDFFDTQDINEEIPVNLSENAEEEKDDEKKDEHEKKDDGESDDLEKILDVWSELHGDDE